MTLHTYTPFPKSLQSINILPLIFSEDKIISKHLPTQMDAMGENKISKPLKASW